jgi:hypothetical protein
MGDDLMLEDHSIFGNILALVDGHASRDYGRLVNPGPHQYRWRMIEHCPEPADFMRMIKRRLIPRRRFGAIPYFEG